MSGGEIIIIIKKLFVRERLGPTAMIINNVQEGSGLVKNKFGPRAKQ
jgi:hypothetical protein